VMRPHSYETRPQSLPTRRRSKEWMRCRGRRRRQHPSDAADARIPLAPTRGPHPDRRAAAAPPRPHARRLCQHRPCLPHPPAHRRPSRSERPRRRGARAPHRRKTSKTSLATRAAHPSVAATSGRPIETGAARRRVVPGEATCAAVAVGTPHAAQTASWESAVRRSATPTRRRSPAGASPSTPRVDRDGPRRAGARSPKLPPKEHRRASHVGRAVGLHHRRVK